MNARGCWDALTLAEGHWRRFDFGGLSIVVARAQEEWRVARLGSCTPDLPATGASGELAEGLDWERWDTRAGDQALRFRPVYPPLPVVARPRCVLNLAPKGDAALVVGIPAWIEVVAECEGQMQSLKAFPTRELSKTWHGSPQAGHLALALPTVAARSYDPQSWSPHDIVCTISLVNQSDVMLPFNRLYLETDHLSVFELDGCLWSNAARIRSSAAHTELSDVTYANRPAKPYDQAVELTPPRKGRARSSTIKSALTRVLDSFNPLHE